jgi:hypothetical protein
VRARFVAGAEQLGISGDDLVGLVAVFDTGDCPATQSRMAGLVGAGLPARTVDGLAEVALLKAAAQRLAAPATGGGCDESCACVTAGPAETPARTPPRMPPRMPLVRSALPRADGSTDSDLVCTLDGGPDAMRDRIGDWRAVIARATGREPADGGVTLVYDHDPAVAVELARLSVAEFACCSFFSFTVTVAPEGMRFTVQAPAEAATVVTAIFGAAPNPVGGAR